MEEMVSAQSAALGCCRADSGGALVWWSRHSFATPVASVPGKTKMWNVAVGGTCMLFIGSVFSYSMYKMKQGGEEVADEIALHEANLAAAQAAAAAEVRLQYCGLLAADSC